MWHATEEDRLYTFTLLTHPSWDPCGLPACRCSRPLRIFCPAAFLPLIGRARAPTSYWSSRWQTMYRSAALYAVTVASAVASGWLSAACLAA